MVSPAQSAQSSSSKNSGSVNGVLPVPASVLQRGNVSSTAPTSGPSAPRLKLLIRRLAPGLTQSEFESALGEEWRNGAGKVDWVVYKPGKVSNDLAKPSRPSRAYLRLTHQNHITTLSDKVRHTSFNDAQNTSRDSVLIGPPSLEYAPYPRVPSYKRRNDARQGLIDQDPEFKSFLESLTNPTPKAAPLDSASETGAQKETKVTTTPLIEHLREKKTAKEKPVAAKAAAKQAKQESKEGKRDASEKKVSTRGNKDAAPVLEKDKRLSKAEKSAKEAVKVLNKEAGVIAQAQKASETMKPATAAQTPTAPAAERRRERGSASIAARMLQRDLGIGPAGNSRRRSKRDEPIAGAGSEAKASEATATKEVVAAENTSPSAPSSRKDTIPLRADGPSQTPLVEKTNLESNSAAHLQGTPGLLDSPAVLKKPPASPLQAPRGPAGSRQRQKAANPPSSTVTSPAPSGSGTPSGPSATASTPPTSTPAAQPSRQAFLKHANPSQGITEPLIKDALSAYGDIDLVTIDKRKGFAYVDFATPEGLQAAIKASPVKVAQGAVVVLERRDKPPSKPAQAMRPAATGSANPGNAPAAGENSNGQRAPQAIANRGGPVGGGFRGRGRGARGGGRGAAAAMARQTQAQTQSNSQAKPPHQPPDAAPTT